MGFSVGGAGKHWAANAWRFNPSDFEMATRWRDRYHHMPLADGLIVQDWGVSYAELEPFYDRVEKIAAVTVFSSSALLIYRAVHSVSRVKLVRSINAGTTQIFGEDFDQLPQP